MCMNNCAQMTGSEELTTAYEDYPDPYVIVVLSQLWKCFATLALPVKTVVASPCHLFRLDGFSQRILADICWCTNNYNSIQQQQGLMAMDVKSTNPYTIYVD